MASNDGGGVIHVSFDWEQLTIRDDEAGLLQHGAEVLSRLDLDGLGHFCLMLTNETGMQWARRRKWPRGTSSVVLLVEGCKSDPGNTRIVVYILLRCQMQQQSKYLA